MPTHVSLVRLFVACVVAATALALTRCGSSGGGPGLPPGPSTTTCGGSFGPCAGGLGPAVTLQGTIQYERLVYTTSGLGPAKETRPARYIDVEIRSAGGATCYGRTSTNINGDYAILVSPPDGASIEVAVFSRTFADANHDITVHESNPPTINSHSQNDVFCRASTAFPAATSTVDLTVPYDADPAERPSIGFGVLDVLVGQADGVQAATASTLPALHAYTRVGNNASLQNTSYYSHSARAIAILGGAAGLPDNSDTDYFDDAVLAHEFHHFVARVLSHSWNRGGNHSGQDLEPNFAWGEGMPTGMGQLLLGHPNYVDTANTNNAFPGSVLFSTNIENVVGFDNNGIGDEFSMAEILWDLADGSTATGDSDADGIEATIADLYAALSSFSVATDGPYIGLFCERLVATSATVTAAGMSDFLDGTTGPEDQMISYPPVGTDVFPRVIGLLGSDTGTLTSVPTGPGSPNPCRQRASSDWYHFTLLAPATVTIQLTITGIGGTGDNLDLYLHGNADVFNPIASSLQSGDTTENINISLAAGTFVIRVEANCGSNNNASYTLTVN